MKELRNEYSSKSFEVISIETFPEQYTGLEKYKAKNEIHYPYLEGNKYLTDAYGIKGFPIFLVINKDREIVKVLTGFANDGEEIKTAIEACF